jgi:histo-blood group ABO system transferase
MRTALVVIATGERYRRYATNLIASARRFFVPHHAVVFTDSVSEFSRTENVIPIGREDFGYPDASLFRYNAFLSVEKMLSGYRQIFYSDADMLFVSPITEEDIFSDGITATEHPGYVGRHGTPEMNPESTAYCPDIRTYFCGGFNGGASSSFLEMSRTISQNIAKDSIKGIVARWHDESHLNRYLFDNPPAKVLSPSFCYPDGDTDDYYKNIWKRAGREDITPKLLALGKG